MLELLIVYSWIIEKTHGWAIIGAVMCVDKDYWKKISFKPHRIYTPYTFYLCCQGSILIHASEVNCEL